MTFDPTSVEVTCVTLPKDHCVQVPWNTSMYVDTVINFVNYQPKVIDPWWPLTPHLLKSCCVQVPWKYIKVYGYSDPFCKNMNQRSLTPRWPLTPHLLRSHVWLYPRIIVPKSHGNTSMYVDTVINFVNYHPKVIDPRWPLTPHLLKSYVWLYPRIIVSKSHENTSKYVDTETLFAKTWTKGHWPLDDLWPHICWGHMCDSTQGSLCPSPIGIHQSMWIQWSILQITTYILHTTYYVQNQWWYYVQNQWWHSLSQARKKLIFHQHKREETNSNLNIPLPLSKRLCICIWAIAKAMTRPFTCEQLLDLLLS